MLTINYENATIEKCTSAIIIPEKASEEAGYIQTLTAENEAFSKHQFQAMAQMAYFQYQDDELEIVTITGMVTISSEERVEELPSGLLLYRDAEGGFHALVHEGLNKKKLLEAGYRFCTRWVRLDI